MAMVFVNLLDGALPDFDSRFISVTGKRDADVAPFLQNVRERVDAKTRQRADKGRRIASGGHRYRKQRYARKCKANISSMFPVAFDIDIHFEYIS
ncbi:hypothetical protein PHO31112_04239 [Pandoraea horticolens]|uniref:Uncharacterized protein n=1 Tax=Pandoraea horticolens TaxID=2508298 RepID=A0A5E4Y2U8_9BURK|nr:hypothetical protein [Pandoraea horticolens]VVE42813.1 hypothetical protein PHO31112_04239 [Pandoraea horticolens]